ncbi:MAG: glutamine synthetase family protein [Pseudomonadota bacterium]
MSPNGETWLKQNDAVESVTVALVDINGVLRGKRLPVSQISKVFEGGFRMPLSACTLDIWGRDIADSELVFQSGDRDGVCKPTDRGLLPCIWKSKPSALLLLTMHNEDGTAHQADARHALANVTQRYRKLGLRPVIATELEFYLYRAQNGRPVRPVLPGSETSLLSDNVLSVSELESLSEFLDDVYAACSAQNVPADAAISENGAGQFEINLLHCDDPLKAADDAVLFKTIVRGVAAKHGYASTFMAKPFGDSSGSGLHVHFSLLDSDGTNVFDNGGDEGTDVLRHAVAGLVDAMQQSTLIFAPHQNSYRRIRPGSHAPTGVSWGYENRTTAIRIPGGNPKARRIEHRVAGADANPYLVLAAILGAALNGITAKGSPPKPLVGNAYDADIAQLPLDWPSAIAAFESGDRIAEIFDPLMIRLFAQAKRQELDRFLETVTEFEHETYLDVV